MAYRVHITRADRWSESDSHPITLEEWIAHARSDPELRFEGGAAEVASPRGEKIRMQDPGRTLWSCPRIGASVWFHCRGGKVSVRSPDRNTLMKMFQIATRLRARVQGDEGETYDDTGAVNA
jgi:hypothetical protein